MHTLRCCTALLLAVCTALAGCNPHVLGGGPEPSSDLEADLKAIEAHYGNATAVATALAAETNPEAARDKLIAGRLVAMNLRYLRFVREVTNQKQAIDSAADILILSLNLAGAALADTTTKTVLAAVSAGVAGSRTTVDKNYFYEKTMPALVASMNAERKKALIPLLKGMKLSVKDYPVAQALTDLDAYYHAGTLMGAVNAVAADAGEKEKDATQTIQRLQDIRSARTLALQWIDANGAPQARALLTQWLAAEKAKAPASTRVPVVALQLLSHAVRSLTPAQLAAALVDHSKAPALTQALAAHTPPRASDVLAIPIDPVTGFDHAKLIADLPADAVASIVSSEQLIPEKILERTPQP